MNRNRWFECDQRREITLWSDERLFKWCIWFICESQRNRSYVCEASENENETEDWNERVINDFARTKSFLNIFM